MGGNPVGWKFKPDSISFTGRTWRIRVFSISVKSFPLKLQGSPVRQFFDGETVDTRFTKMDSTPVPCLVSSIHKSFIQKSIVRVFGCTDDFCFHWFAIFTENIGKADRHISRMIHDAGGYFQIQPVIGMSQVFPFGIVGGGKVNLSSQSPVRCNIWCNTAHESVPLQVFASGSELQNVYRIKSRLDKHGTTHVLTGSMIEWERTSQRIPFQMSDRLGYCSGIPWFLRFVRVVEITMVILTIQFGIGRRDAIHPDTCDIFSGIPGITPFYNVVSLCRNTVHYT